jgi:hypothetical protein
MLARALSSIIDLVQVCRCEAIGDTRFRKSRRAAMGPIVAAGNVYMRWADARITMFVRASEWLAYERECIALVHAMPVHSSGGALEFDRLPGRSLRELSLDRPLEAAALCATGVELRRCHQLARSTFAHGDPHFGNVLWDGARARLIDFETRYREEVSMDLRRANDLFVLCLDAMSSDASWPSSALALVSGYEPSPSVRKALVSLLAPPTGLARVLWASRTRRLPMRASLERASALRSALA